MHQVGPCRPRLIYQREGQWCVLEGSRDLGSSPTSSVTSPFCAGTMSIHPPRLRPPGSLPVLKSFHLEDTACGSCLPSKGPRGGEAETLPKSCSLPSRPPARPRTSGVPCLREEARREGACTRLAPGLCPGRAFQRTCLSLDCAQK